MNTICFFNDWQLCSIHNLYIRQAEPILIHEGAYIDPEVDLAWGYPSVFIDPATGRWRMIYQGHAVDRKYYPLVAESVDGLHWSRPDLSKKIPIRNRRFPHQILSKDQVQETHIAFVDPFETTDERRIKLLIDSKDHSSLAFSAEGTLWNLDESIHWHPFFPDPAAAVFAHMESSCYGITVRPRKNDRRISLIETTDWKNFTAPVLIMEPDVLDPPLTQCYGMPVFPYNGLYVGLLWLYYPDPDAAPFKFFHGKIVCQLTFSRNGKTFTRFLREPFLGLSSPCEYGSGCIYPSSIISLPDGSMRIYSSASKGEHGSIYADPSSQQGAILVHSIRKDGLVYLENRGGEGRLLTRQLHRTGKSLMINVQAPYGRISAAVYDHTGNPIPRYSYDQCVPFSGDNDSWEPVWEGGLKAENLDERVVMIGIRLENGHLYAIHGDFEVIYPSQVEELFATGTISSMMNCF